jgi:hypothetical protein
VIVLAGAVGGQSFQSLRREPLDALQDDVSGALQRTLRDDYGMVSETEVKFE